MGACSLSFTPDSSRLVIGLATSSNMLIVEIGDGIKVLQAIALEAQDGADKAKRNGRQPNAQTNGHANGLDAESSDSELDSDGDGDGSDDEDVRVLGGSVTQQDSIAAMTRISDDGQWLVACSERHVVTIYNLDTLRVSFASARQHWLSQLTRCRASGPDTRPPAETGTITYRRHIRCQSLHRAGSTHQQLLARVRRGGAQILQRDPAYYQIPQTGRQHIRHCLRTLQRQSHCLGSELDRLCSSHAASGPRSCFNTRQPETQGRWICLGRLRHGVRGTYRASVDCQPSIASSSGARNH